MSYNGAINKLAQLAYAEEIGLLIPDTIATSDIGELRMFFQKHSSVIAKTLGGFGRRDQETGLSRAIFTNRISRADLESVSDLSHGPVIFQNEVKKQFEIRTTMVGNRMFSCRIDSQKSEKTEVDWRHYDIDNTPYLPYSLTPSLSEKLMLMSKRFEVNFASFDLAVTPEGDTVFFEMNPNSQWVWIEKLTGLPITDALIDKLVSISNS